MISIGNFFFKYRNILFIFLYLALFIPSPDLFSQEVFGPAYFWWPVIIGLVVTVSGQAIRGATIGLAYIIRGGKDGEVYAEELVTQGIFNHCRNPLYLGNILMLLGVGILSNSLIYISLVIPFFLFIYQAIVLAEEAFLRRNFGQKFNEYCSKVNRWLPNLKGLGTTFNSMEFKGRRWLLKEYNTQYVWLNGIVLVTLFTYPEITGNNPGHRNLLLAFILPVLLAGYLVIRYLKKSGRWKA